MDNAPTLGPNDDALVKQLAAQYDAPAYVRRGRQVQQAYDALLGRCRKQRDEWLTMVRLRLATLRALAGDWEALLPLVEDREQVAVLRQLHDDLQPRLRVPVERTTSVRSLRRALGELIESLARFNRRWREHLPKVDLTPVNELREGYNRWYLLEKECALRSARLSQQGFRKLTPLTLEELAGLLPPLPVPRVRFSV